jgi:hypothetical protein
MLQNYPFEDVDACVELAKQHIDAGIFDRIAEGIYTGLSAYEGHVDAFVEAIRPYYEAHARRPGPRDIRP